MQYLGQVLLQRDKTKIARRPAELDKHIDIAGIACLVTDNRTEECKRLHAKLFYQFLAMLHQSLHDVFLLHDMIIHNRAGVVELK